MYTSLTCSSHKKRSKNKDSILWWLGLNSVCFGNFMFRPVYARGDVLHDYHDGYVRSSPNVGYVGKHTSPHGWYGKELLNTFDDRSLDAIDADLSSCASDEDRMTELQKFIEERTLAEEHLVPWLVPCDVLGAINGRGWEVCSEMRS